MVAVLVAAMIALMAMLAYFGIVILRVVIAERAMFTGLVYTCFVMAAMMMIAIAIVKLLWG